jgi:hypothetical protein
LLIAERRVERLESITVKKRQPGWNSKPGETISGLRQRRDILRRFLVEAPAIVADL